VTYYVVKYKHPMYSVLRISGKQVGKLSSCQKFKISFMIFHPIINIYTVYMPEFPKTTRAGITYFRMIMMLAFSSIFGTSEDFEGLAEYLTDFNIYLILLPYFTVVPIYTFLEFLIRDPPPEKTQSRSTTKCFFYKKKIGLGLSFILTVLCIAAIYILAANKSYD